MFRNPMSGLTMKLKSLYTQINLNRVTLAFFLFSFVHCCAQAFIQSLLFSLDSQFAGVVTRIVQAAAIPPQNMTFLEGSSEAYTLRLCDDIPYARTPSPCIVVFQSGADLDLITGMDEQEDEASESLLIAQGFTQGFSIASSYDSNDHLNGVTLQSHYSSLTLDGQCAQILVYPKQELDNGIREDVAFVFLQFWLLGVSVFAVSQSSISHVLTAFGTRLLTTAWSTYIVTYRTNLRRTIFSQIVAAPGTPCGVNLFPTYFERHQAYDIADFVLSCTGLVLFAVLSWKLVKIYNVQSFNRVGAPTHIIRIHKFFMAMQACLQLEVFALMAVTGLWIDVLVNTSMRYVSDNNLNATYYALIISTTILVLPWLILGWYGVKKESPWRVAFFLIIAFYFTVGWSLMLYSRVFPWTFVQWPCLGCFTVASFILIFASAILGVICWRNFGKGLAQYLHAEAALASLDFAPGVFDHSDVEKSGDNYIYDEPVIPQPTFQSTEAWPVNDAFKIPGPVRGPPPIYEKPYNGLI